MKLYEVNQEITAIIDQMVDPETGEVAENTEELMEQLDSLQMERSRILSYLGKLVLNTRAESKSIKDEVSRLNARRDKLAKKEEQLLNILDRECAGTKTDLGVATFCYRRSAHVEIRDVKKALGWLTYNGHQDCYRVSEPEISKQAVKKLINSGTEVPGCAVVETLSYNLR